MYRTIRVNLPKEYNQILITISLLAGRLYNKTVSLIRKIHDKKGFWLSKGTIQKYLRLRDYPLHSQTVQALVDQYFDNLKSFFNQSGENKRPPFRTPKYHSIPFKQSAIKIKDGKIRLSLGKGRTPLVFDLPKPPKHRVRTAEICWDKTQRIYYLVLTMELDDVKATHYKKVVSIDLGEIHPITTTDGKITIIYNGRLIRSIKQYREKLKAKFAKLLSKCKKYSKRWWQLTKSKNKQMRNLNNSVLDAIHKITRHFANLSKKNRVGVVVIGDLTNIRDSINYGSKTNQKLHQWTFAEITRQLKYKLKEFGIAVDEVSEEDTTKTCPSCGKKNSTSNRNYKCTNPLCRFSYHRDGVGCLNILNKYRGDFPFSKQMELLPRSWGPWQPPQVEGIHFHFHLSNPVSARLTVLGQPSFSEYGVFG